MLEFRLGMICVLTSLISSTAWCAPPIAPPKSNPPAIVIPQVAPALSATDFQSAVTKMSDKNNADLNQQVANLLPKTPAKPATTATSTQQPAAPTTTDTAPLTATPETPMVEPQNQNSPYNSQYKTRSPQSTQTQSGYSSSSTSPQRQTYTGFMGGAPATKSGVTNGSNSINNNSPTGTTKTQAGGGWNIKY